MKFPRLGGYQIGGTDTQMKLSIPLPKTPDGRVYRFSPNELAHPRHFVMGQVVADIPQSDELRARMKLAPRSKQTVCPYSGTIAGDDDFTHPDDAKAAVELVKHAAVQDAREYLADALGEAFGGSSGGGLIKISAKVDRRHLPKPRFSRGDLRRELICDHCGRDYGVFAIALFCPDCGAPNVRLHYAREVELVGGQVTLAEGLGADAEELAYRLLGNAHEDVLTAFEATLKTIYHFGIVQAATLPIPNVRNDFQNVEKAGKRFDELGFNPFGSLTDDELGALILNIQKRHIIGHNLGVIDEKFAVHASDAKVGETVYLVGEDIRVFAAISQKVVDRLDTWLGGSPSPTIDHLALPLVISAPPMKEDDPQNLMRLDVKSGLLARKVALWVAEQCPDGRREFVDTERLRQAVSGTDAELDAAVAELGVDGYVEIHRSLGGEGLPLFRPTLDLYLTFDEVAFNRHPFADVTAIIEIVLKGADAVSADAVFEQTAWDVRRFNPALEYVASHIPDGRVARGNDGQFAVSFFHLLPEDRVTLRRLGDRLRK